MHRKQLINEYDKLYHNNLNGILPKSLFPKNINFKAMKIINFKDKLFHPKYVHQYKNATNYQ